MQRMGTALASVGLVLFGSSVLGLGCYSFEDDAERCYACRPPPSAQTGGGEGGVGGNPVDALCNPADNAGPVGDACGVFVALSGNDASEGTKGEPVKTLAQGLKLAQGGTKRVYACAEEFQGSVTVPAGFEIYGGVDCKAGWGYVGDATPTRIVGGGGSPDDIALRLSKGGEATRLFDLHVVAKDAGKPGRSSIAVLAEEVAGEFVRCTLEAGKGADGANGEGHAEAAAAGADGNAGKEACSASTILGGEGISNSCGEIQSFAGSGGNGTPAGSGGAGSPGEPLEPMGVENGGLGETQTAACKDGLPGEVGADGAAGIGGNGIGALDKNGYVGLVGAEGLPGIPGQGGGGGGGAKGGSGINKCADPTMAGGASGGSGASGGCGGAGGKGGGAGGSSIAVVSLNATLSFNGGKLIAKSGGKGGMGGDGQAGGAGGQNGGAGGQPPVTATALKPGCAGGPGGNGGAGGRGGNGAGGHSIGIAFTGAAPPAGVEIVPGEGGSGGDAGSPGAGSTGVSAATQKF